MRFLLENYDEIKINYEKKQSVFFGVYFENLN